MKKALLVSLMIIFSMFAPFDFSGLDFNFAFAEEAAPKNSPPVAVNDFYKTEVNKQLTVAAPGVLENDSDPDGNMLLSAKLTDPANGMVVMGTDGKFIYVPKTDFTGVDNFTYTVYDGVDGSATATVTITVSQAAEPQVQKKEETAAPKNSPPAAVDDHYITAVDTQLAVVAPGVIQNDSDPDGDFLIVAVVKAPSNGSLSLGTDGGFTYIPNSGFSGTDSFTYSLHDGNEGSSEAVVTITVASAQETNESKEKEKNNEDNNLDKTKKDKDVNESTEEELVIRTLSLPGSGAYDPITDSGIKPYGQYFVNNNEYVNPKTGELTIKSTDLSLSARGLDLVITRIYQTSFGFDDDVYTATNFGNATRLDYPWIGENYLHLEGGQYFTLDWNGSTFEYHKQGVHFILTKNEDNTSTLTRPNGLKYQFDTSNKLTRIEDTNDNYLLFTYNGNNMIDTIEDTLGREADFTYTNGKVSSITLGSRTVSYTYTGGNLTTVTDPLSRDTGYEYNTSCVNDWLITKVSYPTGGFTDYAYEANSSTSTFYSLTADGYVEIDAADWTTARTATIGDYFSSSATYLDHPVYVYSDGDDDPDSVKLSRAFFSFDTSTISSLAHITNVDLVIYGIGDNDYAVSTVSAQKGTQSDTLSTADYGSFSGNEYGHTEWSEAAYYNTISFNSNGIEDIYRSGYTKLCLRDYDYDYLGGTYVPPDGLHAYAAAMYFADYTGTTYDPKLVVNYTVYRISSQKIYESQGNLSTENAFAYTSSDGIVTQNVATTKDGSGNTKSSTTLVFDDEDGTTTSKTVKDASAVQLYKVGYTYNSNLETTQESIYRGNTASVTYTKKFNYDDWGNLVYYEDPMVNRYYYSFINTNYEYSFRDFSGSTVSGFSNEFYAENPTVSGDIHTLLCGKAFENDGTDIESYYKYDSKGNLTYSKNKHNNNFIETSNVYDSWGSITSTTDPLSHTINFEYDDDFNYAYLTRTHASVGGVTHQTTYDYNFATGDIISQTDGEGNTTYYTYDILGRITELEYPDTKTKRAVYDDVNNIVTTYDEKNHYAKQYFDGLGRKIKAETYMNSSLYQATNSSYNYLGLVSGTTDPLGRTTSFTYDALGRITSTTLPDGNSSSREYNDIANTLLVTYENGNSKKLFYDNLGRLVKIEEYPESETTYTTNYYYDDLSNLTQKVLHNGYTESYIYDDLGRLTRTNYPDSTYEEITYDNAGNIISTRDRKANVVTYTYDELNRLVRKSNSDSTSVKYTYDKRSLLIKEEANFSAMGGSGGGGGGSPEFLADTNAAVTNNNAKNFLSGNLTLLGENNAEDKSLASSSDIAYYDRPYTFFGKFTADKEIISKRTDTSKTFDNGDGTFTAIFHAKPIHFKNNLNQWEEIDARIVKANGKFKAAKNKFDISYGDGNLYSVSKGSSSISFTPTKIRINDEEISVDSSKINWDLVDEYHLEGKIADGVYLWLQSHEVFVRHAIKTDRPASDFEAVYIVSDSGYNKVGRIETKDSKKYYLPDENGDISFKDSEGNSIRIPQPIMWNDENASSAIAHELWEENGKLYYRKYATKEGKEWLEAQSGILYLDSSTFYGTTTDGHVVCGGSGQPPNFSTIQSATTGNAVYAGYTFIEIGGGVNQLPRPPYILWGIGRGFLYFDTSSLGSDSIITSAILGGYISSITSTSTIYALKGIQGDILTTADYDAYTGTSYGSVTGTINSYNYINFNSTGINDVNKTGTTKICIRSSGDYDASSWVYPTKIVYIYSSDQSGTSQDPKLEVTYTANSPPNKPSFISIGGQDTNGSTVYDQNSSPTGFLLNVNMANSSDPDGDNMYFRLTYDTNASELSTSPDYNKGWVDTLANISVTDNLTTDEYWYFQITAKDPSGETNSTMWGVDLQTPLSPGEFTGPFDTLITYTYDSRGRLTSETSDINGSTYTTSYSYDDASNITSITYPSTNSYSYTYDDVNRITALTGYAGFTYTDTNMIHTIAYENDITTTYTYDVRDRPTGIAIGGLETLNYTYDPSGNVLSMNDWEYEYDGLNRLEAATSVFDLDYTYDALGNRIQQTENTVTTSYTFNSMMRLTAKTVASITTDFTYDSNGNLTEKEEGNSSYTYTWDINNRLREVRDDGNLLFEYLYDSQGRRVMSHNHSTGVTTTYIYAGINVIHEETSTESTDYLYANGMRIAKKTGSAVKYFHSDHLGSTRLVTDSSGQPTYESDYKPFGQEANATGTEKYAFTGQYSEADIGLYYFGARWYDASLGRFISEDPLKGSMISSQSQNPYVYCMNNPLRYVDPTGMLLTDDPGHVDGYLQTYYGGEYHYYSAMDGNCNVSGESYNYKDADAQRKTFEEEYNRLYGPKQTEPSTTKSEKTNSIYKYDPWTGLRIGSSIPGMNVDISRNPAKQAYDPFAGEPLTGLSLLWWTGGNQIALGFGEAITGAMIAANAVAISGGIATVTGGLGLVVVVPPATIAIVGGANLFALGVSNIIQGVEKVNLIPDSRTDEFIRGGLPFIEYSWW